ncbi:hypothetical protein EHS25_000746 [Saitozyma podzolica]|uniref:Uncharacterized protein n=1 Tax=Saitozyma podzolica TaxID=1890683 RepID=A0A427YX52_9TREE|nr:hypothetical protein EHS25_000746 [Saitozyma podzolica]
MHAALVSLLPVLALMADQTAAHPVKKTHNLAEGFFKREVPQEHSHQQFLTNVSTFLQMNNPQGIVDSVFGLLGNAAGSAGQGTVTNTDCLQQATADQAFTNAKTVGSIDGMASALIYRALERNTASVGLASVLCNETATNPEIQAIGQHQDPASEGAAETNKAIALALAQQLATIGADPNLAIQSGTFAPGNTSDPTGRGNACDDPNDPIGCAITQNLLVPDVTADEISSAVAGITATAVAGSNSTNIAIATTTAGACTIATASSTSVAPAATSSATTNIAATNTSGIDVGPCTDFNMTFAAGLPGRTATQFSFEPTDLTNFNHGTALNPTIISQFMCDTFVNACAQSATTRDTCYTVKSGIDARLSAGSPGENQTYADAWLSGLEAAFGLTSTSRGSGSATGGATGSTSDTTTASASTASDAVATSSGIATAATATATQTVASDSATATAVTAAVASASATTTTASRTNVQTFTGTLNGVSAPAVIQGTGDRPFSTDDATFVNAVAAIQRSCSVQNNSCADAFNSGTGTSDVSACNAQES